MCLYAVFYDGIYAEIKAMVEVEGCLIQKIGQKTPDFSCPMVQKLLHRLDQKINMSVARGYTTPISIRLSLLNHLAMAQFSVHIKGYQRDTNKLTYKEIQ